MYDSDLEDQTFYVWQSCSKKVSTTGPQGEKAMQFNEILFQYGLIWLLRNIIRKHLTFF